MLQPHSNIKYVEFLLKDNVDFKQYGEKNLLAKIRKNDMTDITTQICHLYANATMNNNITNITNNYYNKEDQNNNEDLLKQIEELKKENNELKKENNKLKSRKIPESSDEEDDKISKKKYNQLMDLKNKYFTELGEKNSTIEKLQNEIKDIKEQHNIKVDNKPLDICNEEFSDDEEDEDDENPYEKMEEVEKNRKEKEQQEKQEEENKKTDTEILIIKKEELKQMNKHIEKLELQLQDPEIDKETKRKIGKEGRTITKRKIKLQEIIDKMEQEEEDHINSLLKL